LNITGTNSMKEVVDKINESAGGIVQASLSDAGKLVLTSQNSESITINGGTALENEDPAHADNADVHVANAASLAAIGFTADPAGSDTASTADFSLVLNQTPGNSTGIKVEGDATALATAGFNAHQADGSIQGATVEDRALNKG